MLDVAGNNLANVNSTAFKASRITFAELLSETIKKASTATTTTGGTNPQQMGTGVGIAGIVPNMAQGNLVNTGNPLDLAVEGEGYFVLGSPEGDVYTRAGAFAVDEESNLVDPTTGYLVQRIGSVGEADLFQSVDSSNINIPYAIGLQANATTQVSVIGNLSSDALLTTAQTQKLTSDIVYHATDGTTAAIGTTKIADLDEYTGTMTSGTISYTGYDTAGTALSSLSTLPQVALAQSVDTTTTLADILNKLNGTTGGTATSEVQTLTPDAVATGGHFHLSYNGQTTGEILFGASTGTIQTALNALSTVGDDEIVVSGTQLDAGTSGLIFTFDNTAGDVGMIGFDFSAMTGGPTQAGSSIAETTKGIAVAGEGILGGSATASLSNGKIVITDANSGFSRTDLTMAWSGDGTLTVPAYFELTTVGGTEVKNAGIAVYDTNGGRHVLSCAFTRTGTANNWDMVLTSISGNIDGITMDNRRIKNIQFAAGDGSYSGVAVGDTAQFTITFTQDPTTPQSIAILMGTVGQFNGLTQFAGNSTAVARDQDGYEAGRLSTVSVDKEGTIIGAFSNGVKKDIATVQVALFQNPAALESVGRGYFTSSANSGVAVATSAMTGGAGSLRGGALEKSNADVATEFINMIQAQNGFQANARTIKIANDILRELTTLIR
jgi:flagellar hook protein FlgE